MNNEFISVKDLLKYLYRFKYLIILVISVSIILGYFYTKERVKIYSAEASVIINLKSKTTMKGITDSSYYMSYKEYESFYNTEYDRLKSIQLADEVIKNYNLENHPYFAKIKDKNKINQALRSMLTIVHQEDNNKVIIKINGTDPEFITNLANYYAESYKEYNQTRKTKHLKKSIEWLTKRVREADTRVINAEKNLFAFKKNNQVILTVMEDKRNIITERLQALEEEYTNMKIKRISSEKEYQLLKKEKNLNSYDIPERDKLKTQLLNTRNELEKLRETFKDENPKIISLKKQMENIEKQIVSIQNAYKTKIKNNYLLHKTKEKELLLLKNKTLKKALSIEQNELIYKQNKRTANTETVIYEMLLKELKTNNLKLLLQTNNIEILDLAQVPTVPISPKLKLNLVISFFLGSILAGLLVLLLLFFDKTIKSRDELENNYGLTFLGFLPKSKPVEKVDYQELYAINAPRSNFAENCRTITTNIEFMDNNEKNQVFLVTSPGPTEGKTTIASNLASTMAEQGLKTVVIDTDLRKPRLHKVFNAKNDLGVTMYTSNNSKLDEIIQHSKIENLDFIASGPIPPNALQIIKSRKFKELIEQLKEKYDKIIFDTPPTSAVADALVISKLVDGVVIVAQYNKTNKHYLKETKEQFTAINSNIIGVVLNQIDRSKMSYYSYYKYKKYDYYYGKE